MKKASPAEIERAAILMEECSEIQKCVGKLLRFGKDSEFLNTPGEGFEVEIADVLFAIRLMAANGDINMEVVESNYRKKLLRPKLLEEHIMPT